MKKYILVFVSLVLLYACDERGILENSNDVSYIYFTKNATNDSTSTSFFFYPEGDISVPVAMNLSGRMFDEDDDDFEDEDVFDEEESTAECDEESVEDEDFSAAELIGMCSAAFAVIQQESLQRIQKEEERFNNFVNLNIPKVLK